MYFLQAALGAMPALPATYTAGTHNTAAPQEQVSKAMRALAVAQLQCKHVAEELQGFDEQHGPLLKGGSSVIHEVLSARVQVRLRGEVHHVTSQLVYR
jgi:hypothetical protein